MRRVGRRALLKKRAPRKVNRGFTPTTRLPGSVGTFWQKIKAVNGKCRVCVVRKVGGIGDVLMVTSSLRQLKRDFPDLHLTFAVDMHTTNNNVYYELVKNAPFLDRVIDARYVKNGDYHTVVDVSAVCLRYERQDLPSINRVDLFARAMGIKRLTGKTSWYAVEEHEQTWARNKLRQYRENGQKLVVLHTASMEGKRCWPIEKYLEIVRRAEQDELAIQFLILDFNSKYAGWSKHSNCVDFSRTNVRQMAALIDYADLFIGPDSGPMHLAGAVRTDALVLFGSIPPQARINYYPTHQAITLQGLSCLGCWYKACPYDVKCMKSLEAAKVYSKMKERL